MANGGQMGEALFVPMTRWSSPRGLKHVKTAECYRVPAPRPFRSIPDRGCYQAGFPQPPRSATHRVRAIHAIDRRQDSCAEFVCFPPAGLAVLLSFRPSLRVVQWQDTLSRFRKLAGPPRRDRAIVESEISEYPCQMKPLIEAMRERRRRLPVWRSSGARRS